MKNLAAEDERWKVQMDPLSYDGPLCLLAKLLQDYLTITTNFQSKVIVQKLIKILEIKIFELQISCGKISTGSKLTKISKLIFCHFELRGMPHSSLTLNLSHCNVDCEQGDHICKIFVTFAKFFKSLA